MRLLVVLATAAGALSLTAKGPLRTFPAHPCDPSDCTGGCSVQMGCRPLGGAAVRSALLTPEAGTAHRSSGASVPTHGGGGSGGTAQHRQGGQGRSTARGTHVAGLRPGGSSEEPPRSRNVTEYRTFKLLPPGSMSYRDVAWCPAAHEPAASELIPFHPGLNVMMILGAQKAGTTWLFNALTQHPSVHGAEVGYMRGSDWSKEIHYFDRWPLAPKGLWMYADAFPPPKVQKAMKRAEYLLDKAGVSVNHDKRERVLAAAADLEHRSVFLDASPEYLMHPSTPPRVKQVLPLARFVIVLRDPVARDISSHFMQQRRECESLRSAAANATGPGAAANTTVVCTPTPFDDVVERFTAAKPEGMPDACWRFDTGVSGDVAAAAERKTWQECQQCSFTLFNSTYCNETLLPDDQAALNNCNPARLQLTDYSAYAAQIAWWLAFFPPEQFLILTNDDLRDPRRRVRTLNRVLDHAKLPKAARFTRAMVDAASGFSGNYSRNDFTPSVRRGAAALRQRTQRQTADLDDLLNTFWPSMRFSGLTPEL